MYQGRGLRHVVRAALFGLALSGPAAQAVVIDFEAFPDNFVSHTEAGVTFTAVGGGPMVRQITPNSTEGIRGDGIPIPESRADIAGGATSVSVDIGDFGADADLLFLEVYNSLNVLLASDTFALAQNVSGMFTLSVSSPGIAYAIFGSRAPSLTGSSVLSDNFTFEGAVPAPGTLLLLAAGLLAAGTVRRLRGLSPAAAAVQQSKPGAL